MKPEQSFDYVVVGGGSAGCIVAARLAEERLGSVLLIEAGQSGSENPEVLSSDGFGDAFANDNTMFDRMTTIQIKAGNRPVYVGSGRGLGGSGSVNGMVYTRGDRLDFEQWPNGWRWQDVAPLFDRLEQRLGVRPRAGTPFTEACLSAATKTGFKRKDGLNDGDLCGYIGYNDMNYDGDYRRSSYAAFIYGREQELDLLTIATESRAHRILFNHNKTAIAVEYMHNGVKKVAGINREVVLCSGALETPKLLMLSGVGPEDELDKFAIPKVLVSPRIGKNLHDHPSIALLFKGKQKSGLRYPQVYGFHRYNPGLDLAENQADTCMALMPAGAVLHKTMLRMGPIMVLPEKLQKIKPVKKAMRSLINFVFMLPGLNNFVAGVNGVAVILGKPVSRGELRLNSADPEDVAAIDPAYYSNPADMDTMVAGVEAALKMVSHPDLEAWASSLLSPGFNKGRATMEKTIRDTSVTVFHYCGTCSMGTTGKEPVDTELRVKGLTNVRVADASVIPEVPVSALNAPSMMIGYRAAEFILAAAGACTASSETIGA